MENILQQFYNYVEKALGGAGTWIGDHLLSILLIILVAHFLKKFGALFISTVVKRTVRQDLFPTESDRKKRIATINSLVNATVGAGVWFIAFVMIINEVGINTAPLLASAGVVGVAIGFGAQNLIKDFMSGIFIIAENQYRVGDFVEIENVSGNVEAITIRTTILRDLNGSVHHIPNGSIVITTNRSMGYGSLNIDVTVDKETDLSLLEEVINKVGEKIAAKPEFVHSILEPPRYQRVTDYSGNGVTVKIIGKTVGGKQLEVKSTLFIELKKAFEKNNISIPYNPLMNMAAMSPGKKRK